MPSDWNGHGVHTLPVLILVLMEIMAHPRPPAFAPVIDGINQTPTPTLYRQRP